MVQIQEGPLGRSVFLSRPVEAGEQILSGWAWRVPRRTRHSFQVDVDTHVEIDGPIELINHSCEPNCGLLIFPEEPRLEIYALRRIEAGEELTHDYAAFEDDIQFMPGRCLCGASTCRGRITGYKDLPAERRAALGRYVAPYLLRLAEPVHQAG